MTTVRFWTAAILFLLIPTAIGAWLLPHSLLSQLANEARWGGPLWFGVIGGLVGLLRQRLQGLCELAAGTDDWQHLEHRLRGAQRVQNLLDRIVAASLALGLLAFFVPTIVGISPPWVAALFAASPVGSAGVVAWIFVNWSRWRRLVDQVRIDILVRRRRDEQRKEQVVRLEPTTERGETDPPTIVKGRIL